MKLNQWSIVAPLDPYKAPEQISVNLYGIVEGHPEHKDGRDITTSRIVGKTPEGHVRTRSGSTYELGDVDPAYEAEYPGARERLMETLPMV